MTHYGDQSPYQNTYEYISYEQIGDDNENEVDHISQTMKNEVLLSDPSPQRTPKMLAHSLPFFYNESSDDSEMESPSETEYSEEELKSKANSALLFSRPTTPKLSRVSSPFLSRTTSKVFTEETENKVDGASHWKAPLKSSLENFHVGTQIQWPTFRPVQKKKSNECSFTYIHPLNPHRKVKIFAYLSEAIEEYSSSEIEQSCISIPKPVISKEFQVKEINKNQSPIHESVSTDSENDSDIVIIDNPSKNTSNKSFVNKEEKKDIIKHKFDIISSSSCNSDIEI